MDVGGLELLQIAANWLCQHRTLHERPPAIHRHEIGDSRARDVRQRLASEERLVGGDEHVRKYEQPRQLIVLQHPIGQVFEEDTFLLLVDIQCHAAEASGFERLDQRRGSQSARPG